VPEAVAGTLELDRHERLPEFGGVDAATMGEYVIDHCLADE
jgi:hypothetical protein